MKIQSFEYTGEGMRRVYENGQWTVGIKNYKPANDKSLFNELERHNAVSYTHLTLPTT